MREPGREGYVKPFSWKKEVVDDDRAVQGFLSK